MKLLATGNIQRGP